MNSTRVRPLTIASLLIAFSMAVVYFQACTSSPGRVAFESLEAQANGSVGRGDSYDGKPDEGSYYRMAPDTRCGTALALYGQIDIQGETVNAKFLDTESCMKKEERLALSQLEYDSYMRGVIGFGEGVFERKEKTPDLSQREAQLPEVWCRSSGSSETHGLDVLVRGAPATGTIWPSIAVSDSNLSPMTFHPSNALRSVKGRLVQYKGDGFQLDLDLGSQNTTGAKVTGHLIAEFGGQRFDQAVSCRTAGALDTERATAPLGCPSGFVPIASLAAYTQSDFCVAKYESKQAGALAVSQPTGAPWVNITRAEALAACQANGMQYDLISNNEWQTIARGTEMVPANWSGGAVGVGALSNGHSDGSPNLALSASADDDQSCIGTGQTCDLAQWDSQRRTFQLANGSIVWDLGGNVIEWVKDDIALDYGPRNPIALVTNLSPYSNQAKDRFGPAGDYSVQSTAPYAGLGLFEPGTAGALMRGGVWYWGPDSGVFETTLTTAVDSAQDQLGFRCVFHP